MNPEPRIIQSNLHGRRKGRPLTKSRAEVLETLLPLLRVEEEVLREDGRLDPALLFRHCERTRSNPEPGAQDSGLLRSDAFRNGGGKVILEIGFGQGERLAAHMEREPEALFLAAEPFINGMAAFLKSIAGRPHDNIRVLMDDAMRLARSLADASLDAVYILNPDPWPKARHHKRRIVNPENLDVFARILKPGGKLIMTTDVEPLAEWMVTHAARHPAFRWTAQSAEDWRKPPEDWIPTRYETKRAKGASRMSYLIFERCGGVTGRGQVRLS